MAIHHPWMLEVTVLTPIDTVLFLSNDIMSRHKERSINRPFKRYATSFVLIFSLILCVLSWGFINWWIGIYCSRKHLGRDMKVMFHNCIYAHRWPKLIKYQLHHHCTAHSVVNPINSYPILLLDRGYIYNFCSEILSNFNSLNDSD